MIAFSSVVGDAPMVDDRLNKWRKSPRFSVTGNGNPLISKLLGAIESREVIEIVYYGGSTPGMRRRILPRHIFRVGLFRTCYVNAYCYTRGEDRTFRVDRMRITAPTMELSGTASRTQATKDERARQQAGCLASITFVLILVAAIMLVTGAVH
jgi:predicted DNA-binding transcriptional regulator YafY